MPNPTPTSTQPHASRSARYRNLVLLALALASLACGAASSDTAAVELREQPLVEVFVTDWCPYCKKLEAFLKQNRIAYQRRNIEQDAEARAEHQALGGGGIPVTRIGGRDVIRGFRPAEIAEAIGLNTKQPQPPRSQSSAALRMRPSASLSPSRKASAASCLLSPMSVTRTS